MKPLFCFFSLLSLTLVSGDWVPEQHVIRESLAIEKSVAIIGGGAAGTSTAFWLSNIFPKVKTTLYEKSDYLGGRSKTVNIKDDARWGQIELGASIFVEANKNLMKATDIFGLKRIDTAQTTSRPGLGIWDGKEFLFEETGTYWDTITPIWRYGLLSPLKFQRKQKQVVEQFMKLYNDHPGFDTMNKLVESLEYDGLVNQTAIEYLKNELGTNDRFAYEILQSATRGNYCQDLNRLHPFALMVSMEAGHGTWAVQTGNFRIFEEFAVRSGANVQLNTTVTAIYNVTELDSSLKETRRYVVQTSDGKQDVFDQVVLASPLASSGIDFGFPVDRHHKEYHTVHVTLVAGHINPIYFNKQDINTLPTFIITTGYPLVSHFENSQSPFQTFSIHRFLDNGENVVKIFSSSKLNEQDLDPLFLNTSWIYRKEWHAFPELYPISKKNQFPHFVLKADQEDQDGIIYTGAFESFISTMETQTISGKNAARLIYDKWCKNRYCQTFGEGWGKYEFV